MYKEKLRKSTWVLERTPLPDQKGTEVISPLHYADTVEVLLVRGIEGEFTVNGRKYPLEYENVFFIPQGDLHSAVFRKGGKASGDMISAFHINIDATAAYIDIKKLLTADGKAFDSIPTVCGNFDEIYSVIREIIDENYTFSHRVSCLIRLFEALSSQSGDEKTHDVNRGHNATRIAEWIESNYQNELTVAAAAEYFGYSKNYFCKWIKKHTGSTFNDFLNAVRINHACLDLVNGLPVSVTAERCGFSDTSYFIKVFKKVLKTTPRAYVNEKRAGG